MTRSKQDIITIANSLLKPQGLQVTSCEILQRLWAGYGHICRLQTTPFDKTSKTNSDPQSFILKLVTPPTQNGKQADEGHLRKLISYKVEQYFYTHLAPQLPSDIVVAKCVASVNETKSNGEARVAMVLSDLRESFPVEGEKRGELSETQVYAALRWLGGFHGFWWQRTGDVRRDGVRLPPLEEAKLEDEGREGVWLNGGYTYLATRLKEYRSLKDDEGSEWRKALCTPVTGSGKSIAELVAQVLSPSLTGTTSISDYDTLIHGDVKSENLFTTTLGTEVAFFDFQYVGLGLGVCDLAKLFTCSVPLELLTTQSASDLEEGALDMDNGERKLLEYYQQTIEKASGKTYPWQVLELHWKTALVDWLRFQASWGFWGNTEWLEARVRHILKDEEWRSWVLTSSELR